MSYVATSTGDHRVGNLLDKPRNDESLEDEFQRTAAEEVRTQAPRRAAPPPTRRAADRALCPRRAEPQEERQRRQAARRGPARAHVRRLPPDGARRGPQADG